MGKFLRAIGIICLIIVMAWACVFGWYAITSADSSGFDFPRTYQEVLN